MEGTTKPIAVHRCGPLSASIFANPGRDGGTFHKVSLQRTYADASGAPKSTTSLGRDDLPVAALLLQRAWATVVEAESKKD